MLSNLIRNSLIKPHYNNLSLYSLNKTQKYNVGFKNEDECKINNNNSLNINYIYFFNKNLMNYNQNNKKTIFNPSGFIKSINNSNKFLRNQSEFFEPEFLTEEAKKGEPPATGRSWRAAELRLKSYDDLHKLWYVLLKERNMLLTEKNRRVKREYFPLLIPQRLRKVRKSMARIQCVVGERNREYKAYKQSIVNSTNDNDEENVSKTSKAQDAVSKITTDDISVKN
eukprot:TRINITY_DN523_c0_g2_i1.p2 TRINITY_DN523_c0_g2~~TRINITY_DN523_c0_g2_i1.p2  ORF type:complete len:226 (-),score=58.94 TRINITY_DN523_c0_g2_i1:35-712(-)